MAQYSGVRVTRNESFPAWSGTRANLESLERLTEDSLEQAYKGVIAELQVEDMAAMEKATTLATRLRLNVSVTSGTGSRLLRTGAIAAILAEMDLADVDRVVLRNQRGDDADLPEVYVELNKRPTAKSPVTLRVMGDDKRWVAATMDMLAAELRKRQPSWAFMRRGMIAALFAALLTIAGVTLPLVRYVSQVTPGQRVIVLIVLEGACVVVGMLFLGNILHGLFTRWFPALDLTEVGGTSQVRRVGAIVASVMSLGLAIAGLVVPLMMA